MAKILIVEDEEHILRLLEIILRDKGHEILTAISGEQALELHQTQFAGQNHPNLMIIDIVMKGMDGLKLLKELKLQTCCKEIPVILLSALAQENVVKQGLKLGARGYITKPFHPKDLLSRVHKFLDPTRVLGVEEATTKVQTHLGQ